MQPPAGGGFPRNAESRIQIGSGMRVALSSECRAQLARRLQESGRASDFSLFFLRRTVSSASYARRRHHAHMRGNSPNGDLEMSQNNTMIIVLE